jgi:hypothetical protein
MAKVTTTDIDALWGPATPQFDPVRKHGERRLAELDELGHDTSKGTETAH